MKVFVDMDDTAARLAPPWLKLIEERLGEHLTEADITGWETLAHPRYQDLLREPGLFRRLEPERGVRGYLTFAKAWGHRLHILSAARDYNVEDKRWWVERYLPGLFDSVLLPVDTNGQHTNKGDYAAPGLVLIDDAEHNLKAWRAAGGIAVCFDRPWNQKWDGMRMKAWSELPTVLAAIERGEAA